MHPRKEKSVIHFNLALILILFITQKKGYDRATNGVMMQHEVKCTPNNQCKCIVSMKIGYATTWNAKFFFKWLMQAFLYEILTNNPKKI